MLNFTALQFLISATQANTLGEDGRIEMLSGGDGRTATRKASPS